MNEARDQTHFWAFLDVNFTVPFCVQAPFNLGSPRVLTVRVSSRSCPSLSRNHGRGAEIARRGGSGCVRAVAHGVPRIAELDAIDATLHTNHAVIIPQVDFQ